MILQALAKYYDRLAEEGGVAPEGFKRVEIPFLIILNRSGEFVGLQDTRIQSGKKLVARAFLVPQERGRSGSKAWQISNLLWDHYGYVVGWPKSDSDGHKEMARGQHMSFLAEAKKLYEKYPGDMEIGAVYHFLKGGDFAAVFQHPSWSECVKIPGCNLTFKIEGQSQLVCECENVQDFIAATSAATSNDEDEDALPEIEGICLISGERASVARLHPRTPISGAKSNAKIVSFQKNMGFDSYGKLQSYNAPTSKKATFAYTTALNEMLAKNSRQKLFVGDASTVFWAEKKHEIESVFADLFGEPAKGEPEQDYKQLVATFRAPEMGAPPQLDPKTGFFVLGLAPNAARIAVRFWYAGSVGEVAGNMEQHFDDIEMTCGPKQPQYLSLFRLLVATAALGKSENIAPNLAGELMKAILIGAPYPHALLGATIRRCRAEREITYPRASLIKAVLTREARYYKRTAKEVGMSLDTTNSNVGYRLGRLFATLEKIQEEASPGINATIRDRFYGSASSTPVAAFPHLMKLKNHHLSKLANRGRAVNLEKVIGEIIDGLNDFPTHLSLPDQGRFAVGYYHQRQAFFTSS
jgi:CRISPR-associated protein Csd1